MIHTDSKRLSIILPYLYPNLKNNGLTSGDYELHCDAELGYQLIWHNKDIAKPTDQEITDAKESAVDDFWWKQLRRKRDKLLIDSDWSQGADVPSAVKSSYVTYRTDLRDLPTTATKPDFSTLDSQGVDEWISHIDSLMPSKPEDNK